MPVLKAEPAWYPAALFDVPEGALDGRRWSVMHTRPQQEKKLARELYRAEVPFYLPLVKRRLRMRNRTLTSHVPVFSGYVFVCADAQQRLAALTSGCVVRPLEVADQDGLWRDLRQVAQLICSGAPIMPEDRLGPGTRVVIRSGPLAGLEGVIIREATGRRFVVQVDFLQRGASALLDDCVLVECK